MSGAKICAPSRRTRALPLQVVPRTGLAALAALALAIAPMAWFARDLWGLKHPYGRITDPTAGWFSRDPDGLYHARRVERVFREGLPVEGTDPFLDFPHGARIPWPPYYDLAAWAVVAPLAPAEAEPRHAYLERALSTLPALFGVASALLAALAGWLLAGLGGAALAGGYAALCWGSINYSHVGNGDHHAWVSMLNASLLLLLTLAVRRGALASRRRGLAWGAACGALAGALVGSWVAALLYVLAVQLVLAWLLVLRAREPLPGVATLGFAFHATALAVLLPAVLASPWREELPWIVVNLSWFQPALLALGALAFVPPLALEHGALAPRTRAARLYAPALALAILAGALVLALSGAGPARGIAEGFAWVSRADRFMHTVLESKPLLGGGERGTSALFLALGYGVLALPFAWAAAAWLAFRRGELELLPWVVAVPPLLAQALAQRRFADALAVPMAVLLGWGFARLARRAPAALIAPAGLALAVLAQLPSLGSVIEARDTSTRWKVGTHEDHILGERRLFEWLREHTSEGGDYSVLCHWDRGHAIEWIAWRPSVATNFGSYVGEDSYRDPARFFLAEDPDAARALLERRRVRYVVAPAALEAAVESMARIAGADGGEPFTAPHGGRQAPSARWWRALGGRLLRGGAAPEPAGANGTAPAPALDFLRLVHVSPFRDARFAHPRGGAQPAGFVWERVAGARLEARGVPGDELEVRIEVHYPGAAYSIVWQATAMADGSGLARLRVPYATDSANGDGLARAARWSLGGRGGALEVPARAVVGGEALVLP